jgi:hypothetical protein
VTLTAAPFSPAANEDRIPDDVAVCVEYEGGVIARTYVGSVPDWGRVVRFRYGWPPR